jgi:hypothetical protein
MTPVPPRPSYRGTRKPREVTRRMSGPRGHWMSHARLWHPHRCRLPPTTGWFPMCMACCFGMLCLSSRAHALIPALGRDPHTYRICWIFGAHSYREYCLDQLAQNSSCAMLLSCTCPLDGALSLGSVIESTMTVVYKSRALSSPPKTFGNHALSRNHQVQYIEALFCNNSFPRNMDALP